MTILWNMPDFLVQFTTRVRANKTRERKDRAAVKDD